MPAKKLTLEDRFDRVEEHLVGLWRFRVRGQKPKWCCTYVFDGCYYDTTGDETKDKALDNAHRNLTALRRRREKKYPG